MLEIGSSKTLIPEQKAYQLVYEYYMNIFEKKPHHVKTLCKHTTNLQYTQVFPGL